MASRQLSTGLFCSRIFRFLDALILGLLKLQSATYCQLSAIPAEKKKWQMAGLQEMKMKGCFFEQVRTWIFDKRLELQSLDIHRIDGIMSMAAGNQSNI